MDSCSCKGKKPKAKGKKTKGKSEPEKPPCMFRLFYDRGDLPVAIDNGVMGPKLFWRKDLATLDYHHLLPIMFDGLQEMGEPHRSIATRGVHDMLEHGGSKVTPVVPQLIIPIKTALSTRNKDVICRTLKAMQKLVLSGDLVGEALLPYFRQLLPMFNAYKHINVNIGDRIDYSQRLGQNVGDLIGETLELLERNGGEDAFINIKYMIPEYESVVHCT